MDLSLLLNNATALAEFVYASPFGIIALFIFALIANASLFFPISVEPVVLLVAAGAPNILFVLIIGAVIALAAALGEMSGYIFGMIGVKTLQKFDQKRVEKIFEMSEKLADKGIPLIFLGAFTPFPFDIIGLAAGLIRYDVKKFFLAAFGGKLLRYELVALVGFFGVAWLKTLPWLKVLLGL